MKSAALKVNNLSVTLGSARILDQIGFEVNRGESVGIIGPNGSGKTTLFNALGGFLKRESGQIFLSGREISSLTPNQRAMLGLGRVFQNSGIFRELSLEENLQIALESRDSRFRTFFPAVKLAKSRKLIIENELKKVGLLDKRFEKAGSLSGGQLRLLEIVRTVMFKATVLLLDEPTAGVAPGMKEKVGELISGLSKSGSTILIIEHDLRFIQNLTDRVLVLNQGKIVMDGATNVVRADPQLQQIYFG